MGDPLAQLLRINLGHGIGVAHTSPRLATHQPPKALGERGRPPGAQTHSSPAARPSTRIASVPRKRRRHWRAPIQIVARIAARIVARNALPEIFEHPYRSLSNRAIFRATFRECFGKRFGQHFGKNFGQGRTKFRAKFRARSGEISSKISVKVEQNFGQKFGHDRVKFRAKIRARFGPQAFAQDITPNKATMNCSKNNKIFCLNVIELRPPSRTPTASARTFTLWQSNESQKNKEQKFGAGIFS